MVAGGRSSRPSPLYGTCRIQGRGAGGTTPRDHLSGEVVLYDTVVASIELDQPLDDSFFKEGQTVSRLSGESIIRLWHNPEKYGPRITYWRKVGSSTVRLRVEFSIPHLLHLSPYGNPTHLQALQALGDASAYINMLFKARLPRVGTWQTSRIDYAWNWD